MKLKEFNKSNSMIFRSGKSQISVNSKTGVLCFTKEAAKVLNLQEYDKIKFFQDEETKDWYIEPTKAADGFPLRKKSTMVYTNSTVVANGICEGITDKSASFLISNTPEKHGGYQIYLIIKSSVITRSKPPSS